MFQQLYTKIYTRFYNGIPIKDVHLPVLFGNNFRPNNSKYVTNIIMTIWRFSKSFLARRISSPNCHMLMFAMCLRSSERCANSLLFTWSQAVTRALRGALYDVSRCTFTASHRNTTTPPTFM